jgi:hypothetical protein
MRYLAAILSAEVLTKAEALATAAALLGAAKFRFF